MNAHMLREAGYLRLEPELKLALLNLCHDAAEDSTLVRPSIAGIMHWTGAFFGREAHRLVGALVARGLLRLVEDGEDPLYEILVPCDCPDGEGWLK